MTVDIQRTNFTGPINLSLESVPNGIQPSMNPVQTSGNSATLSITVASTVTLGSYSLTIRGSTGAAGMDRSTTLNLTVTSAPTAPPPTPPPPTPEPGDNDYTLSVSPATVSTAPGTTIGSTVTVTWIKGIFDVDLTFLSATPGVTGTIGIRFQNVAYQTITIDVAANVPEGTYAVSVQGSGGGLTRTAAMTVVVTSQSSFSFALAQSSITVAQNRGKGVAIVINRMNVPGAVPFSVENAPTGILTQISPNPVTGTSAGLSVNVLPSVPVGTYALTVRAKPAGLPEQVATLEVNVILLRTFDVTASPASHGTYYGATVASTISVSRTNWPGDITLSVSSFFGITASLSNTVLSGSTVSSTLTMNVPANLDWTGGTQVYVRAESDTIVRQVNVTLFVQREPYIFLHVNPNPIDIKQGNSGTTSLSQDVGSYTGQIAFSVTGAPTGMSVSLGQNPLTGNSSTPVTVNVGASVPLGTYKVTITGSAAAGNPASSILTVNVIQ